MPRGDNEGSIFFDKRGAWYIRLRFTDAQGRRREKKRRARDRADAMQIKERLRAEIAGEPIAVVMGPPSQQEVLRVLDYLRGSWTKTDERREEDLHQVR